MDKLRGHSTKSQMRQFQLTLLQCTPPLLCVRCQHEEMTLKRRSLSQSLSNMEVPPPSSHPWNLPEAQRKEGRELYMIEISCYYPRKGRAGDREN